MDIGGLRGSASTRIDEKGRLKVPADFRVAIGADLFVTSLTGQCVRVYPMAVWQEIERKLSLMPANHPSRLKFLDRVSYYGQTAVMDSQGRVVLPAHLRTQGAIVGDVRVFGRIDYLEVWNEERFARKLEEEPWVDDDGLKLAEHGI